MKSLRCAIYALFLFSLCASASVKPGENILVNGELKTDRTDTPPLFWFVTAQSGEAEYCLNGGPDDKPYVHIINTSGKNAQSVLRQLDLQLVAGERYKISAWFKATDYSCNVRGVSICNAGWEKYEGVTPANGTYDWTFLEKEFTLFDSSDGKFFAAIFSEGFTGELCVADVRLTALTEAGQMGSSAPELAVIYGQPTMVPWEPLLHRIPADNPVVSFHFYGKLQNMEEMDVVMKASDCDEIVVQPLQPEINTLRLPEGARSGILTVSLRDRKNGEEAYSKSHTYAVIDIPAIDVSGHRRLNNLCTEVLNKPLEPVSDIQEFSFTNSRDGWIYLAVQDAGGQPVEVVMDGKTTVLDGESLNNESFHDVPMGRHTLAVRNTLNGGRIVVRAIAETLNYCPVVNSIVTENPTYDWDFQVKYGLPAITTQNGGSIPDEKLGWFRRQGYRWIANQMSTNLKDDEDLTARLDQSRGMIDDRYDGVTCDEQFFFQPVMLQRYTRGLHAYTNPKNRLIYSWIVGKPATVGIDQEFLSECVNASGGRGRLLLEAYCHTAGTEQGARETIADKIVDNVRQIRNAFPNVLQSLGVILGNFNQVPILSLHHHPEVDMKYFLDLQLNSIANDPCMDGLGAVGYWGSYYADHEFHRWSYMLLRHYVVEGKTTMLSDEYGFSYRPGHVVNGDFTEGFQGWEKSGNVTTEKYTGYANASQNRWGGNMGVGDTMAVFSKQEDEVSTLSQTAQNLVPGRTYLLQFATCDVDYVKKRDSSAGDFGIRATLDDGAEIREDLSWQYVDRRGEKGRYEQNNGVARINLHHIVFTALKDKVEIKLDNQLSKPGENLGVNFFAVTPFLLEN